MKKIYNIINSELIVRTNNVKLRQEFGEVGTSPKITAEGTSTIFTTLFVIKKVNYITVNGINLIEGVHYTVDSSNKIRISNSGAPVRKNPSLTTTILVSYYAGASKTSSIKVPPTINFFSLSRTSGKNGEIVFDFSISPHDGKNIYWSILKDGNSVPLHSGKTNYTTNGISVDGIVSTRLNTFITETEYLNRQGENIPFTFLVVYDLSEDGSQLDEKAMATANFLVDNMEDVTGNLTASPALIQIANAATPVTITYNINKASGSLALFDWAIYKSINGGVESLLRQGNQASPVLSGTYDDSVSAAIGNNFDVRYYLRVKDSGSLDFRTLSNDKVTISVPSAPLVAHAGYLDAAIMSYIDPEDGVRKKIGSLGTAQDLVEYTDRIPAAIFTKDLSIGYITSDAFMAAPVNTFGNTVTSVYFVIELPDNWGPVDFYQTLGLVNQSAFNKISLGNGYTAYLYNAAPSAMDSPSDYYLKARP